MWAVLAVVLVFAFVSAVCSIDVMFRVARLASGALWAKIPTLVLGAAVWVCGVVAQVYVFLIWLEERAVLRNRAERGIDIAIPAGVLAYLKYSRALPPWILIVIFVVLPLGIMAGSAPLVALMLATVAGLAPVAFKKFDS
jgi:hypothetical protein